jgi:hypothetical protein
MLSLLMKVERVFLETGSVGGVTTLYLVYGNSRQAQIPKRVVAQPLPDGGDLESTKHFRNYGEARR